MKRSGRITIDDSRVIVEPGSDGEIRLTHWELAQLLGVYTATITANIRAIIRSGAVRLPLDCPVTPMGNTLMPESVGMDIIIALAFRLDSPAADTFRKWVIGKAMTKSSSPIKPHIIIGCGSVKEVN
ncbi:MAG: hypothetical protein FWE10_06030 [Rikenellaceae bacterium]|nr:hypothetical protein [Rikenellaceae bacterium]MCL2692964.1 hypothetical protein [Rikenellaceae bacterium]